MKKLGQYAALVFAVYIILLDINYIFIFAAPNTWITAAAYEANFRLVELLPEIYGFVLYPVFLFVVFALIRCARKQDTLIAYWADFFGKTSTILVMLVYFIQFAVAYPAIKSGNAESLALWIFGNPNSIVWGLNYFGWFLGALAIMLMGFMLRDTSAKVFAFGYGGALGIAFVGYCTGLSFLEPLLGLGWFILMPAFFLRLSMLFQKDRIC